MNLFIHDVQDGSATPSANGAGTSGSSSSGTFFEVTVSPFQQKMMMAPKNFPNAGCQPLERIDVWTIHTHVNDDAWDRPQLRATILLRYDVEEM
jgi:hypothetical protein